MNKPLLYIKSSMQVQADFQYVVEKYFEIIQWRDQCNVLDVGCGPGNSTYEKLLPLLPKTTQTLVGVDVSQDLIDYAKLNYQNDPRIHYRQLDIGRDIIPKEFVENFDNIFSFYCLHYVKDLRSAVQNMAKMLKPGGQLFISFLGRNISTDIYRALSKDPKWKPLVNFERFKPPTSEHDHPEKYVEELLANQGLTVRFSDKSEKTLIFPKQTFIGIITAIEMFNIPSSMLKEYGMDVIKFLENRDMVRTDSNGEMFVHTTYTLLTALASKPL